MSNRDKLALIHTFIEAELEVRRQSFLPNPGPDAAYITEAEGARSAR